MKIILTRWLSALLVAILLLSNVAIMEEAPEAAEIVEEVLAEAAEEIVEADEVVELEAEPEDLGEPELEAQEAPEPEAQEAAEEFELAPEEETELAPEEDLDKEEEAEIPPILAAGAVAINATNFPDSAFRNYLSKECDENNDGVLSEEEIENVYYISLSDYDETAQKMVVHYPATSLVGIGVFTNLSGLFIEACNITTLDLSKNANLETVNCGDCKMTKLDISGCANLRDLMCYNNQLTNLDVSHNPALEYLCCWDNKLTSLNVANCPNLIMLACDNNQLTALDVTKNTKLASLTCTFNKITKLDISKCPTIAANVKGTGVRIGGTISFNNGVDTWWLECDDTVELTGGSAVLIPTVKVTGKAKYTVDVGVKLKIDPDGTAKGFKSSKKKVATVDSTGLVTPKAKGKTKITFKVGKKTRTLTLTVNDPSIPSWVKLDKAGTITWYKQDPLTLNVTLPNNTWTGLKWKSSNKKVATVSYGKLTFKKAGTTTITVTTTRGKKKAKVKIKVIDGSKASAIKINPPASTTLKVGEKLTLTASATIARPSDPKNPTKDPKAKWTSSNKKVLSVNKTTGEITAKKAGTATITVTAGSKKKARIKITVVK